MQTPKPSREIYTGLQSAYDHFNRVLFSGELPQAMIVLHRKRGAHGYFWAEQFADRKGQSSLDEIALNPASLIRDEEEALSTLVHEMCHLWQHHFGEPSRSGYHNQEWADKMEGVGLVPSDTGEEGGKRTGQKMTHYIEDGGKYEKAYANWRSKGSINWSAHPEAAPSKARNKTRYVCDCEPPNVVYGKPNLGMLCLHCGEHFANVEKDDEEQ